MTDRFIPHPGRFIPTIDNLPEGTATLAGYEIVGDLVKTTEENIVFRARRPGHRNASVIFKLSRSHVPTALKISENEGNLLRRARHATLLVAELVDATTVAVDNGTTTEQHPLLVQKEVPGLPANETPETVFYVGMEDIAEAVDAIGQQANIGHRDITPSNCLISKTGTGRLIDFGIGVNLGELIQDDPDFELVMGTPGYITPEQGPFGRLTHKSNVFQYAATLASKEVDSEGGQGGVTAWTMGVLEDPVLYSGYQDRRLGHLPIPRQDVIRQATAYYPHHRHNTCGDVYESYMSARGKPNRTTIS